MKHIKIWANKLLQDDKKEGIIIMDVKISYIQKNNNMIESKNYIIKIETMDDLMQRIKDLYSTKDVIDVGWELI